MLERYYDALMTERLKVGMVGSVQGYNDLYRAPAPVGPRVHQVLKFSAPLVVNHALAGWGVHVHPPGSTQRLRTSPHYLWVTARPIFNQEGVAVLCFA